MTKQEIEEIEIGCHEVELEMETKTFCAFMNLLRKQGLSTHDVLSKPVELIIREYVLASNNR